MAKVPKPNPLRKSLDDLIKQAEIDAKEMHRLRMETHLRNGLENGVPIDSLSAVFNLSVEEIQHFEQHGQLEE
ncbi:hypothetical protein [Erwinia phage vB_Ea277G]|nr:hypothetical protein [Erwinia phage vB_Ea277G]